MLVQWVKQNILQNVMHSGFRYLVLYLRKLCVLATFQRLTAMFITWVCFGFTPCYLGLYASVKWMVIGLTLRHAVSNDLVKLESQCKLSHTQKIKTLDVACFVQTSACSICEHIEAETKMPPFLRRHFQMHFIVWNVWISLKMSLEFASSVRINDIPVLVQIMVCHRSDNKLLSEKKRWLVNLRVYASLGMNDLK